MRQLTAVSRLAGIVGVLSLLAVDRTASQSQVKPLTIAPASGAAVRDWDITVNRMLRARELEVRLSRNDTLLPGRTVEQLDQYHQGVRVWGGSLSRQLVGNLAVSVFGQLYEDISVNVEPTVTQDEAKAAVERIGAT